MAELGRQIPPMTSQRAVEWKPEARGLLQPQNPQQADIQLRMAQFQLSGSVPPGLFEPYLQPGWNVLWPGHHAAGGAPEASDALHLGPDSAPRGLRLVTLYPLYMHVSMIHSNTNKNVWSCARLIICANQSCLRRQTGPSFV